MELALHQVPLLDEAFRIAGGGSQRFDNWNIDHTGQRHCFDCNNPSFSVLDAIMPYCCSSVTFVDAVDTCFAKLARRHGVKQGCELQIKQISGWRRREGTLYVS
jgi:hypothetical protein